MVRLRDNTILNIVAGNTDFNSSMVRLRGYGDTNRGFILSYFNSSMVRLRVQQETIFILWLTNFNSSMVRLRASMFAKLHTYTDISIPVWCD